MPHSTAIAPIAHRLRGRISNFADQIYSVQAFAFASMVLGDERAIQLASQLAERLVSLQGPLGQWWWHDDFRAGDVAEGYPVYSVHQYAMAHGAFGCRGAAVGPVSVMQIQKSHQWLGYNELGVNMIDEKAETIWRDIRRSEGRARSLLRKSGIIAA